MSAGSKAWIVATSIGVVEALKDQGLCRWNFALRSIHQHYTKINLRSYSQVKNIPAQYSSAMSKKMKDYQKMKQSEDSFRTVMYLSCWGPNS